MMFQEASSKKNSTDATEPVSASGVDSGHNPVIGALGIVNHATAAPRPTDAPVERVTRANRESQHGTVRQVDQASLLLDTAHQ